MRHIPRLTLTLAALLLAAPWAAQSKSREAFTYVSPRPDARWVPPETGLLFRPAASPNPGWRGRVSVTGTAGGVYDGTWSRSGGTWMFRPGRMFRPGEKVSVSLEGGASWSFSILEKRPAPTSPRSISCLRGQDSADPATTRALRQHGGVQPAPRPQKTAGAKPFVSVTHLDNPEEGHIFLGNFAFSDTIETPFHMMIIDNGGNFLFCEPTENAVVDFKKQPNGNLTYFVLGRGQFHAMDSTYTVVDSFAAGNGYSADFHDLQILPNGHALLMIYDEQFVDMSAIVPGGSPTATVIGLVIQELDAAKNVVFQWRSWDHFQITDSNVNLTGEVVDYVHGNSVELDDDGNILLSSRHMDEVTKIDRATGDMMWRMGGNQNQFTLLGDTLWFSRQHDVRRIANGNITLFDNGNAVWRSRAVEYMVDEVGLTLTPVWEYVPSPTVWGYAMGSSQRLPGGNTLVGWGSDNPTVTEVRPDGTKAFELTLAPGVFSYRAFRFLWNGDDPTGTRPTPPPAAVLEQNFPNPFNPGTVIPYRIRQAGHARLEIYDVAGHLVRRLVDRSLTPGPYETAWDGKNARGVPVASGVYFYRLRVGPVTLSKSMTILR